MIDTIGNTLLKSDVKSIDEAKELATDEGTIGELIVNKTAKIGENFLSEDLKLLLKVMMNILVHTFIWEVKLHL